MSGNGYGILRDSVNGVAKYCRVLIRRRRASAKESSIFLRQSIIDLDDLAKESEESEEVHYIRHAQACMLTALDSLTTANAVRCINCRHHDGDITEEGRYFIFCTKLTLYDCPEVSPDFFCGLGEPEVSDNGKV